MNDRPWSDDQLSVVGLSNLTVFVTEEDSRRFGHVIVVVLIQPVTLEKSISLKCAPKTSQAASSPVAVCHPTSLRHTACVRNLPGGTCQCQCTCNVFVPDLFSILKKTQSKKTRPFLPETQPFVPKNSPNFCQKFNIREPFIK